MPHARINALVIGLTSICLFGSQTGGRQARPAPSKPIVIIADVVNGRVVYTVDSKPALPDLLRVLNILEEQRGKDYPVVALIDARARITEFGNIDGTAGKAQLNKIRFFVFDRESRTMAEVQWLRTVPFSTDPPPNPDPLGIR
jgi:hypothetical protein